MSEKLPSGSSVPNGWELTESKLLVPGNGANTYIGKNDVIVTDSRSITPQSAERSFRESQEKARQPLNAGELSNAAGALMDKVNEALAAFRAEHSSGDMSTSQEADNMQTTVAALARLKDMYGGKRDIDQKNGESIDDYINRRVGELNGSINTYHAREDAVDSKGYEGSKLYEFARMHRVHDALTESPEKARAAVLGEAPVIKGADDIAYLRAMLGTMTYGEDIRVSSSVEQVAA